MRFSSLIVLLAAITLTACSHIHRKQQLMSAAGFKTVLATTPEQVSQLKTLPQGKVTPLVKNGKTLFFFADSQDNCIMIGTQKQYQQYQQYALQYKIQQDKVEAASLNADADYEWGAWGGMMGPGFY